jgi:uncharacterized protein (DUF2141 family)
MAGKTIQLYPLKRSLLLATVLALSLLITPPPYLRAGSDGEIRVVVKGLRDNQGRVGCSLFKGPDGFPREKAKEFRGMWIQKDNQVAVCDFEGVPAGTYAVAVLDDTNMNGEMDFNFIGLPTKGYGFSNDAKATLSPPSFIAASFRYSGEGSLRVPINIAVSHFISCRLNWCQTNFQFAGSVPEASLARNSFTLPSSSIVALCHLRPRSAFGSRLVFSLSSIAKAGLNPSLHLRFGKRDCRLHC